MAISMEGSAVLNVSLNTVRHLTPAPLIPTETVPTPQLKVGPCALGMLGACKDNKFIVEPSLYRYTRVIQTIQ